MTYIDKAKYIMDNYNFCTYQTPIRYNGMNVADPSTYFWRLFTPEYYRISHTKGTFHDSDYVKFLSEYEYKDENLYYKWIYTRAPIMINHLK